MKRINVILAATLLLTVCGCTARDDMVRAELFSMDTYCTLEAHGGRAREAVATAQDELERLAALLSISEHEGDVCRINAAGEGVQLSTDTAALLRTALAVSAETDGAFDVTVEPIVRLWGFYDDVQRVPDQTEIEALLDRVDYRRLLLDGLTLNKGEKQAVDLGGVAKGYASDRIAERMRECGVDGALISLGGNVYALGTRQGGGAWRVGVRDPFNEQCVLGVVEASDRAIVTAGSYQRYFEAGGVPYHHILDPRTGRPAQSGLVSVTVIAENGARADALSTALFVMGAERAVAFWKSGIEPFDMLLVSEQHELLYTGKAFIPDAVDYRVSEIVE